MKKSLAVASASFLGLGAVVVGAAPAHAADVTTECTTANGHEITTGTLHDNWFMDCVPQYGLGKAEFTITSTDPFPADFTSLDDPAVSSTYSGGGGAATYFGAPGQPAGFAPLDEDDSTSNSYTYVGNFMFPISGVQSIDPTLLPAVCNADTITYSHAYQIDYGSASTTFTQTAGGEIWTYEVESAPPLPVYLGLNFSELVPGTPDATTSGGELDPALPQCAIFNGQDAVIPGGDDDGSIETLSLLLQAPAGEGAPTLPPFSPFAGANLGDIEPTITPLESDDGEIDEGPALADTGVDALPGSLLGGAGVLAGFGLFFFGRRMKRRTT